MAAESTRVYGFDLTDNADTMVEAWRDDDGTIRITSVVQMEHEHGR